MPTSLNNSVEYINTTDYAKLSNRLLDLKSILDDNEKKQEASRELRYAEVDIEGEREADRIQPDELYVPQHIIDSNIRREQASYVQYVTESARAVVVEDLDDDAVDLSRLEKDLTKKLRFDGWQLGTYSNIDGFQEHGYGIKEVVQDQNAPGHIVSEYVQLGDIAFISDTKDLQSVEMTARTYYYTKTQLHNLCDPKITGEKELWTKDQVDKVIGEEPTNTSPDVQAPPVTKDKSLYKIHKVMFRVEGTVNVAWTCIGKCDDWLREPRKLFLGRREIVPDNMLQKVARLTTGNQVPNSKEVYETQYPYFLYPYLISENDTVTQLKGRVYLDQDTQEAVSSLLSSTITQARRAAGMYFSRKTSDPNEDVLMQKNIFFRSGCIVNADIQAFKLDAPDPGIFQAIQLLVTGKSAETSQVAFATQNRKDSRKTAQELKMADGQEQKLSTVQVVLFAIALRQEYSFMASIIKSRVLAGVIKVDPTIFALYQRNWTVKPSGDVDVIEKQKLIQSMMTAWPVVEKTAAAPVFLTDLLEKLFPSQAAKYIKALTDAQQQAQSQQAQQMQQMMQMMMQMAGGIINLSKHPEMFSDTGRVYAYPIIDNAATQMENMKKMMEKGQQGQQQTPQLTQ